MDSTIRVNNVNFYYDDFQALTDISLDILPTSVTAFIGPSGCGKSTLLRCFNRMNDVIKGSRVTGDILIDDISINDASVDVYALRRKVGMLFQRPIPFPKSIFDNVAYGLEVNGFRDKSQKKEMVENALKRAALWTEVKDGLNKSALALSGGQQQRLCLARAIVSEPKIILMDEPTSALDPISTVQIEELITELGKDFTIIIVTHNMQQAARISQRTAFFYLGKLIEFDSTNTIFNKPKNDQTKRYITGQFG
jgi:phosphate transport system ATP-binding protein